MAFSKLLTSSGLLCSYSNPSNFLALGAGSWVVAYAEEQQNKLLADLKPQAQLAHALVSWRYASLVSLMRLFFLQLP